MKKSLAAVARVALVALAMGVFGGCAHDARRSRHVSQDSGSSSVDGGLGSTGSSVEAKPQSGSALPAPLPRSAELVSLATTAMPSAKNALVVGHGTRALADALRAASTTSALDVEERAPMATASASKRLYDIVLLTDAGSSTADHELRERVAPGGVLVARWVDGEPTELDAAASRFVERAGPTETSNSTGNGGRRPPTSRLAMFTHRVGAKADDRRFEHLLVARAGSAPLGIGDLVVRLGLVPSEPFIRDVWTSSPPMGAKVQVAGFAVRLPSGETVVDVPHSEQGATHVRAPAVAARLSALAGPKPSLPWLGEAPDPQSFAGALHTGRGLEGTRTSSTIVVVEGTIALSSWHEAEPGVGPENGVRTYELVDARITSTVTAAAWAPAFAAYEAAVKKLPRTFESIDLVKAELALEGVTLPLERLLGPGDGKFFEPIRFQRRLLGAMRSRRGDTSPRETAAWLATTLPERSIEGSLFGRPRPTHAERAEYRTLFLFGGITAHRAYEDAKRSGELGPACALLGETLRLLSVFDPTFPMLRDIKAAEATAAQRCGIRL